MNDIVTEKRCPKCGENKLPTEFYKDKQAASGLMVYCKECAKKSVHKWHKENPERHYKISLRWLKENKERATARAKAYKEKNKEDIKAKSHERYLKNGDKQRKAARLWQLLNPERALETWKNFHTNNPGKSKEYNQARLARLRNVGGRITAKEWRDLCSKYDNKCLCCGRSDVKLSLDHVLPISKGGTNTIDNAQPLCISCNSSKRDKHIDYRK